MLRWINFNFKYLGRPRWDTGVSPPELIRFIQESEPGLALDLGCGTGTNLITLAKVGWNVTGVDYGWIAVNRARKNLRHANLDGKVFCRDVSRLEFLNDTYDLILDIGCFHGLKKKQKCRYVDQVIKLLSVRGNFLLYGFLWNIENPFGIQEKEIQRFMDQLKLISRSDGVDNGGQKSVWLHFCKN